jgi:hypothetical protein
MSRDYTRSPELDSVLLQKRLGESVLTIKISRTWSWNRFVKRHTSRLNVFSKVIVDPKTPECCSLPSFSNAETARPPPTWPFIVQFQKGKFKY